MSLSPRRTRAILRKELRAYRRNRPLIVSMAVIPIVFLVQPLVMVLATGSAEAAALHHRHELLYMLGIPALVPAMMAAYTVVAERQQGTLEPLLSTPLRRSELLVGKALAVLLPSIAVAYVVFAGFLALVAIFAQPHVASSLIRAPDLVAQALFTPLVAAWSIWIAMAISTAVNDIRVAQQLSVLASLPTIAVTSLTAFNIIHPSLTFAVAVAVALVIASAVGWRLVAALFDRERLITATR